jgi:hypothetical protein
MKPRVGNCQWQSGTILDSGAARNGQDDGGGARGAGDRAGGWSEVKPRSGEGAGAVAYGDRSKSTTNPAPRSGEVRAHGAQGGAVEVGSPRRARIARIAPASVRKAMRRISP